VQQDAIVRAEISDEGVAAAEPQAVIEAFDVEMTTRLRVEAGFVDEMKQVGVAGLGDAGDCGAWVMDTQRSGRALARPSS